MKDFFSKCDQIRNFPDLVFFTEEILNGKLHFFVQLIGQAILTTNVRSIYVVR